MSRTNHKNKQPYDFYPTPRKFIELLGLHEDLTCDWFLEPAAGDGRIFDYIKYKYAFGYEIRVVKKPFEHPEIIWNDNADFLEMTFPTPRYDLIVTNPPFSLALEFVRKCLSLLTPNGRCIMLLRVGFLHTSRRYEFNKQFPPIREYKLAERPRFKEEAALLQKGKIEKDDRGTDGSEYSWVVWEKGFTGWTKSKPISLKELDPKND